MPVFGPLIIRIVLLLVESYDEDIVNRIDGNGLGPRELCVRTLNNADGSDVTVRLARIDPDSVVIRYEDLVVNRVYI